MRSGPTARMKKYPDSMQKKTYVGFYAPDGLCATKGSAPSRSTKKKKNGPKMAVRRAGCTAHCERSAVQEHSSGRDRPKESETEDAPKNYACGRRRPATVKATKRRSNKNKTPSDAARQSPGAAQTHPGRCQAKAQAARKELTQRLLPLPTHAVAAADASSLSPCA